MQSQKRIRTLEDMRCRALANGDLQMLETLLSPDFNYVHASGRIEERADYLKSLTDPLTEYGNFVHREVDVKVFDGCALMLGLLTHTKSPPGEPQNQRTLVFRYTAAWAAGGVEGWSLLRWHNTKVMPPLNSAP